MKAWLGGLLLLLAACSVAPVQDVRRASFDAPAPLTLEQAAAVIKKAGRQLGWVMTDAGPGQIQGKLASQSQRADVTITYDATRYSIRYEDSANFDYDGFKIDKNYNAWVQNLERRIRAVAASA